MPFFRFRLSTRKVYWVALGIFALVFFGLFATFFFQIERNKRNQELYPIERLAGLSTQIQTQLAGAKIMPQEVAKAWKEGRITDLESASTILKSLQKSQPAMYCATIALDPDWVKSNPGFARNQNSLVYTSFVMKPGEEPTPLQIPYDYTDPNQETTQWYTLAAQNRRSTWFGPYFGKAAQTHLVGYSSPLFDKHQQFIGVATAEYALLDLRKILLRDVQKNNAHDGYTIMLNQEGVILYHPRVELMQSAQTMRNIGEQTNNLTLLAFSDSLDKQVESGAMNYQSIYTRESTRFHYQRIPDLGWYLVSISPNREGQPFCYYQKQIFLLLLGALILIIWTICMLWYNRVWTLSIGISVLFSVAIALICWISVKKYESGLCAPLSVLMDNTGYGKATHDCSRTPLNNAFAASAYMNRCFEFPNGMLSIPTGMVVQTVTFTSAHSFTASGYIWQKYRNREDTSSLGVEFPENESIDLTQAYDDSLSPNEFVRGWHFSTAIRQPFSYARYPLDKEEIWFRLRPAGLAQNVILEPDFLSYRTNKDDFYGIDQNLVLAQWSILSTNFSYALNRTSSNYGKKDFYNDNTYPELYFSIHVRRNILDAFISQFIPLVVIILMLFSILWVGRKSENGLLGFNSLSGASGCSALFFIVIYNHINIRNQLGSPGVVYMEYFFFITYLALLFVSLNSIQVALDKTSRFINYNDNLVSRVLFWPVVTGGLFACTFAVFW